MATFQDFLNTVETDISNAWHVVEEDTVAALQNVWSVGKSLFVQFEPTLVSDALAAITAFLPKAQAGGDLADLEQAFLEDLEAAGSTLFGQIQGLASTSGSTLLQVLIALAKDALKL
jgi:hypothetical protein